MLLKYGFAINEPEELEDGTVLPVTIVRDMRVRSNHMDETHHPLDNEHDRGGPRARTDVNNSLGRSGSRSTRSWHHVTAVCSVNLAPGANPPMFIFTSKANNPQVKSSWVETLANTRGKWGHKKFVDLPPFVSARPEGSMDNALFMDYIDTVSHCVYFIS